MIGDKFTSFLAIWFFAWVAILMVMAAVRIRPSWRIRWLLWVCPIVLGVAGSAAKYKYVYRDDLIEEWRTEGLLGCVSLIPVSLPLLLAGVSVICTVTIANCARILHDREHAGQCLSCGYDLRGNTSGRCPECGTPIPVSKKSDP